MSLSQMIGAIVGLMVIWIIANSLPLESNVLFNAGLFNLILTVVFLAFIAETARRIGILRL